MTSEPPFTLSVFCDPTLEGGISSEPLPHDVAEWLILRTGNCTAKDVIAALRSLMNISGSGHLIVVPEPRNRFQSLDPEHPEERPQLEWRNDEVKE